MYNKIREVSADLSAIADTATMLRSSDIVKDGCVDPSTVQNLCSLMAHVLGHIAEDLDCLNHEINETAKRRGVNLNEYLY